MSSAFKNFFITFAVCLLVFGFIGLQYVYPWLSGIVNFDDMGQDDSQDPNADVSDDTSEDTSTPIAPPKVEIDENGDVFTAVVLCVDSNGRAVNCAFIDSNAKTKRFIYSSIPTTMKVENEIGVPVPIGDLFSTMSPYNICQAVSAMTGIETNYCLRFDRDGVKAIANLMPGASVSLNREVSIRNPEYEDYIPVDGEYPEDYNITISNVDGRVRLDEKINDKTKLEWLLEYNPNHDGSEYNEIYSQISKALLQQFFKNESLKSNMGAVIKNCDTNLTSAAANEHLETIFSYNEFQYYDVPYSPNRDKAIADLRNSDGSYK